MEAKFQVVYREDENDDLDDFEPQYFWKVLGFPNVLLFMNWIFIFFQEQALSSSGEFFGASVHDIVILEEAKDPMEEYEAVEYNIHHVFLVIVEEVVDHVDYKEHRPALSHKIVNIGLVKDIEELWEKLVDFFHVIKNKEN